MKSGSSIKLLNSDLFKSVETFKKNIGLPACHNIEKDEIVSNSVALHPQASAKSVKSDSLWNLLTCSSNESASEALSFFIKFGVDTSDECNNEKEKSRKRQKIIHSTKKFRDTCSSDDESHETFDCSTIISKRSQFSSDEDEYSFVNDDSRKSRGKSRYRRRRGHNYVSSYAESDREDSTIRTYDTSFDDTTYYSQNSFDSEGTQKTGSGSRYAFRHHHSPESTSSTVSTKIESLSSEDPSMCSEETRSLFQKRCKALRSMDSKGNITSLKQHHKHRSFSHHDQRISSRKPRKYYRYDSFTKDHLHSKHKRNSGSKTHGLTDITNRHSDLTAITTESDNRYSSVSRHPNSAKSHVIPSRKDQCPKSYLLPVVSSYNFQKSQNDTSAYISSDSSESDYKRKHNKNQNLKSNFESFPRTLESTSSISSSFSKCSIDNDTNKRGRSHRKDCRNKMDDVSAAETMNMAKKNCMSEEKKARAQHDPPTSQPFIPVSSSNTEGNRMTKEDVFASYITQSRSSIENDQNKSLPYPLENKQNEISCISTCSSSTTSTSQYQHCNTATIQVPAGRMGLTLKSTKRGPLVLSVSSKSVCPTLQPGDLILTVDGINVSIFLIYILIRVTIDVFIDSIFSPCFLIDFNYVRKIVEKVAQNEEK